MPEFICSKCGQQVQGDDCPRCRAATAIATPEHAEQAKVTPPAPSDGAIGEGLPPHVVAPSIHKETPHVFVQLLPYVIVVGIVLVGVALVIPAVMKVREAAARTQSINNMKQIALACHSYHDANRRLPSPKMAEPKDGKLGEVDLSWRVSIIPYLEASPFFREFDTTKGWDDPRNRFLQDRMHIIYHSPWLGSTTSTKLTYFQYFTGPETLFPDNAPRKLSDIQDGSERTLMFAEADQPVIWMQPADMAIRQDQPLPLPEDRFLAAMADATVRMISRDKTSDAIVRQLINPNDGKSDPGWDAN
jgi:hypothetical protein